MHLGLVSQQPARRLARSAPTFVVTNVASPNLRECCVAHDGNCITWEGTKLGDVMVPAPKGGEMSACCEDWIRKVVPVRWSQTWKANCTEGAL